MSANRRAHRRAEKLAASTQATTTPEKAKDTAAFRKLVPIAKEANAHLAAAAKAEGEADDYTLAASLLIASAEDTCKEAGIKFKQWAETSIDKSWDYTTRLLKIARAPDPALALADRRMGIQVASKKHREKKKDGLRNPSAKTMVEANGRREPVSQFQTATKALADLDNRSAINLMTSVARERGMAVVPKADLQVIKDARAPKVLQSTLAEMQTAFALLSAADQMQHATYVAGKVGCTLITPDYGTEPALSTDPGGKRPAYLDRRLDPPRP